MPAQSCLRNGNPVKARILFAHGAGAPMDSDFMSDMAERLASDDIEVIRFEFPYMQKRREDGKRRPPDRQPKLLEHLQALIIELTDPGQCASARVPLLLAGKSMGGRMSTMLAELPEVAGCFVFGYPFYAPGKQDKPRTEHLLSASALIHIFQGTRDPMGNTEAVSGYQLSETVKVHWLEDGDHDLKPRKASGLTHTQHLQFAADACIKHCLAVADAGIAEEIIQ